MKMYSLILGSLLLVTSGCFPMYGRGDMMNARLNRRMVMGRGSGDYRAGPMVGAPVAPRYVRGAASPMGGSSLHGSGYLSPEAVATADSAYLAWEHAPVPTGVATAPLTPMAIPSPSSSTATVVADPGLTVRVEALEVHALEESLRD